MSSSLLWFLFGLGLLVYGADRAVRAAANLALHLGVSAFFVGVTVISVGTSIPEMTASVIGGLRGAGDLVVGGIVGSEVAQATLAVGIVALIRPVVAERRNVAIYGSAVTLAMIIMILTLEDGRIIRSEGFLMMFAYVFFVYHIYTTEGGEEIAREVEEEEPGERTPARTLPRLVLGVALVVGGGHLTIDHGLELAGALGASEYLVGLLAGLGTTLPEIFVAGLAARAGQAGISVGALLGSNITDPVFSLGIGALATDLVVADPAGALLSTGYMVVASVAVLAWMFWRRGLGRRAALGCFALYLPTFFLF